MRIVVRLACAAAAGLLLLASGATLTASAVPAPGPSLSGTAPAIAHGPGALTFTYTLDVPTAIDSTVFTTHQDPALPARATGVTLDGAAVPTAQVTQSGTDIAVQVGANPADGLTAGTHTITFTATVGPATATTSSTAALAWTESGIPGTAMSAAVAVAVNQIDLATTLTPDSGEDQLGFIGTGGELLFEVDVSNLGYGSPDTQLELDLPVGLALGPDGVFRDGDGSSLSCAPAPGNAQHIICDLGVLKHATAADDPTLDIDLIATPAATVGQTVALVATASPKTEQGIDVNPANDTATAHVKFTGAAALSYTITPARKKVQLGATTTVRLTVHNAGPQPAGDAIAFSIVVGNRFKITGFSGNTTPPAPPPAPGALAALAAPAGSGGVPPMPDGVLWFVGDIAPGHTASATLTLQATRLGSGQVGLIAFSTATDPNCPDLACDLTRTSLQVVPVPPPDAPASTPPTRELADTGTTTDQELGIAAALLLVGALLLFAGRRRRLGD